jgi:hypothetical protein
LIKAFRFEKFEICLLKRILDSNVIAARLKEFRKYDRTSNWACVRQILAFDAIESSLVTTQGSMKSILHTWPYVFVSAKHSASND